MIEFINTADVIGDDEMCDQIIMRTVTEYKEDRVTKIGYCAFYNCAELEVVEVPNVVEVSNSAFYSCTKLHTVNLESATYIGTHTFAYCASLSALNMPSIEELDTRAFYSCTSLTYVDMRHATFKNQEVFNNCTSLHTLIMRRNSIVPHKYNQIGSSQIENGNGYIYVPRNLLDTYKVTTGWAQYGDYFRALEDYTVDGTVDGDLDPSKI